MEQVLKGNSGAVLNVNSYIRYRRYLGAPLFTSIKKVGVRTKKLALNCQYYYI